MASNQVSITGDLWRRLHDAAELRGMKMTDLVDQALASKSWTTDGLVPRSRRPTVDVSADQWRRLCEDAARRTLYGEPTSAHDLLETIIIDALDGAGAPK